MHNIATSEVSAGARLAKPVLDQRGRVLLEAGAELTPAVLDRLSNWQVSVVCIEDDIASLAPSASVTHAQRTPWTDLFASQLTNPDADLVFDALRRWGQSHAAKLEGTQP